MPETPGAPDGAALRQAYDDGVEAAAAHFDRLADDADKLVPMALSGAQVQEFIGRVLALRLHAAAIRKLKKRD
jgi:hypothetical protein